MEEELNLHYQELTPMNTADEYLLANQVQRLMMCFDVYLETKTVGDEGSERPLEFAREKMYMRITRYLTFFLSLFQEKNVEIFCQVCQFFLSLGTLS